MCHQSPWYDGECENQRKMYNTLCNQYSRAQDDDDKLRRNDAKLEYVKLCKIKTTQHENLQIKDLMNAKHSGSKMYWKMIKPMANTNNVVHVKPEEFRNYFELLFTSINDSTPDHSEYICEVDVLDSPFTLHEVERSIKHLKGGKDAGHDNIKSNYILLEQGNLKFVILTLLISYMKSDIFLKSSQLVLLCQYIKKRLIRRSLKTTEESP